MNQRRWQQVWLHLALVLVRLGSLALVSGKRLIALAFTADQSSLHDTTAGICRPPERPIDEARPLSKACGRNKAAGPDSHRSTAIRLCAHLRVQPRVLVGALFESVDDKTSGKITCRRLPCRRDFARPLLLYAPGRSKRAPPFCVLGGSAELQTVFGQLVCSAKPIILIYMHCGLTGFVVQHIQPL